MGTMRAFEIFQEIFFFIWMTVLLVFLSGNVANDECWLCDVSVNKHSSWSISSKRPKSL